MCIKSLFVVQFEKMEYYAGVLCEVWKNVTQVDHKKNTYRLWVTRPEGNDSPAVPYHYEMMGFNTLLGSHYDKYIIDYSDYSPRIESDIFKLPGGKYIKHVGFLCFLQIIQIKCSLLCLGMTCGDFPGPGVEHHLLANPLQDLIHTSPVGHAHRMFGHFKEKFERQYENETEHEKREHNFVHNIR